MSSLKNDVFDYIKKKYRSDAEYSWMRFPEYAVFRHDDNKKWFALYMIVSGSKLGLDGDDPVEALNLKIADPLFMDLLCRQDGYSRGYHMGKSSWITVLLDGTVPFENICAHIDESYVNTASKTELNKIRPPKEWLVPANPKYYDIEHAFDSASEINWKQGAGIKTGDTVYMYVGAPGSAILYKCKVTETGIPFRYAVTNLNISALMKIKLIRRYKPDSFTFEKLKNDYGIFAVRGPRGIPHSLREALKKQK